MWIEDTNVLRTILHLDHLKEIFAQVCCLYATEYVHRDARGRPLQDIAYMRHEITISIVCYLFIRLV